MPKLLPGYWESLSYPGYAVNADGDVREMIKGYRMRSRRVTGRKGRFVTLRTDRGFELCSILEMMKESIPPF